MASPSILNERSAKKDTPNWIDLPPELTVLIMQRIGWYYVLMNVKKVCKSWYILSKDPSLWRVIDISLDMLIKKRMPDKRKKMEEEEEVEDEELDEEPIAFGLSREDHDAFTLEREYNDALQKLTMDVVDMSCGQLLDLCILTFGSDDMFQYIYRRSSQLRRLRLEYCNVDSYHETNQLVTMKGLIRMLGNLPLLEELHFVYPNKRISKECIEVAGRRCPHLKSFTLNQLWYWYSWGPKRNDDDQALAIANNMPGLRHLQLFGNRMTIDGLTAILDNCHYLEYLDLRQCYNLRKVFKKPDFRKKLHQQVMHVRYPQESDNEYQMRSLNLIMTK